MVSKKIALLGGSFDPIHLGHQAMAKGIIKAKLADEVWFLVAKQANFKTHQSSFEQRLAMCKLAIRNERKFKVCTIEAKLSGTTYTYDVINRLNEVYTNHQFKFVIGEDQANNLSNWYESNKLQELIDFIIIPRFLATYQHATYPTLNLSLVPVSSSEVRSGNNYQLVDSKVVNYFNMHHLYLLETLQAKLTNKRYLHSVEVAELAKELALVHGVDLDKAYVAGLLHDIAKEIPYAQARVLVERIDKSLLVQHPALWHGPIGAHLARHYYQIKDKAVLNAIKYHISGQSNAPLAMIIYLADKLERTRNYDTQPNINLAKQNLAKAFKKVKVEQQEYLAKER